MSAATRRPPTQVARVVETAFLSLVVLFAAYLLFHLLLYAFGRDQAVFSVVGKEILSGKVLYRDITDFKTPAIYFVYAIAHGLLGPGQSSVRVIEVLAVASLLIPFLAFSKRYLSSGRAGLLAWGIGVFAHVRLEYWNTAQTESFGGVALIWAFSLVDPPQDGTPSVARVRARWLAAGALFSLAALLKPVMGLAALVPLVHLVRRHGLRSSLRAAGSLLLGAASLPALTLGYFVTHGALSDLHRVLFVTLPRYAGLYLRPEWFVGTCFDVLTQWLSNFSPYFLLGFALLLAFPPDAPRQREGALTFAAVAGLLLLGVAGQAKFFAYHYGAALWFGSLLAGWGIWGVWRRLRPHTGRLVAFAALLVILHDVQSPLSGVMTLFWKRCGFRIEALRNPEKRDAIYDELYSSADMDRRKIRSVAEWIAASTPSEATLLLWSFEPLIHVLADRRPATRFVYDLEVRLAGVHSAEFMALMRDLRAAPPDLVVIQYGDRFPSLLGNADDSATALGRFQPLRQYLAAHYEPVQSFEGYQVLERKRPTAGP